MFIVIWEFKIKPGLEEQFENSYGRNGEWVEFFKSCKDYLGTELIKATEASRSYITIDRWNSEQAYVNYLEKNKLEYEKLDDHFTSLTEFETKIGGFNSLNPLPTKQGGKQDEGE